MGMHTVHSPTADILPFRKCLPKCYHPQWILEFVLWCGMLSDADLEKICRLSKIKIADGKRSAFLNKLNQVFNWIEQISKIDVSGIGLDDADDMSSTPERPDTPHMTNSRAELLSNTKHQKFDMFSVPKVVE
jgi:aspartyl/glutamyl-tRNA(Asn/Gln) amidotransferase C subunit